MTKELIIKKEAKRLLVEQEKNSVQRVCAGITSPV